MSWRDDYQRATWRGVPFHVESHEGSVGRRTQVHEFPLRDKPFAEDLGRATRVFNVEGFVFGDTYMQQRDALLAACERAGPGQLQHPYLGEMRATCLACVVRESTAEGGRARFTMQFVESGESRFPTAGGTSAGVVASAQAASKAAEASFVARHSVAGKPLFVAEASAQIFTSALDGMTAAVGTVRGLADEAAALQAQVDAAKRDVTTLLFQPASAAQALASNVEQLVRGVAGAPREALNLARLFYRFGFDLPAVDTSTSSRLAQAVNQAEMLQLVRTVAAAEGARAAVGVAFESYQDAIAVRDELADALDALMLGAADDAVYDALRGLRAATVRDITARGADLARLVTWTPRTTMPVLVAAHQVYADATRYVDLLARNAVRHPLFVPGGKALEVLSDAA